MFDGKPVPVAGIFRGRIVCIAPQDLPTNQSATIQVNANGTLSNPLQVDVAPVALGLLSANGSGQGDANARNQDGTLNSAANPATRGTTVTVYFTGAGVPPAAVSTNFGTTTVAPLSGFLPGIYAAYFEAPTDPNYTSPLTVTLFASNAPPALTIPSSQSLTIYIK
jgi:uncharacterized protein (TIGR03437 family)